MEAEKSMDNSVCIQTSGQSHKRKRIKTTCAVDLNSGASTSENVRVENTVPYGNSIGQASYQRGRCGMANLKLYYDRFILDHNIFVCYF